MNDSVNRLIWLGYAFAIFNYVVGMDNMIDIHFSSVSDKTDHGFISTSMVLDRYLISFIILLSTILNQV